MRTLILAFLCLLALPVSLLAQAVPGSRFGWTQTAATLADAQGFTYRVYLNGVTVGNVLTATCTATATPTSFACSAPIPAVVPGPHTATFTAANAAGESAKSTALSFTMQAVPAVPTSPSIIP